MDNILKLAAGACADAIPATVPGTTERKNLLIAQRMLVKTIANDRILPGLLEAAGDALQALMPRIDGVLHAAGIAPLPANLSSAEVRGRLAQASRALAKVDAPHARDLHWACIDIEAAIDRAMQAFYDAEMARLGGRGGTGPEPAIDSMRMANFLADVAGVPVSIRTMRPIPGGFSKVTLILDLESGAALPPAVVVRLDQPGGYLNTRVADEYAIIAALHANGVKVPRPIASEPAGEVVGVPFIVVEAVAGQTIGDMFNLPAPNPAINAAIAAEMAKLHRVPLSAMAGALSGTHISPREQATAWLQQSRTAWEGLRASSAIMDAGFAWLVAHLDRAEGVPVAIHGDLGLNNILIDGDQVTALLDWEFVCAGHAAYDLGYFHCMGTALGDWNAFLASYVAAGGILPTPETLDFFILFANVRLATMVWQGATAFERGQLTDLIWANPGAHDQRVATLRVAEQLRRITRPGP